MRWLLSVFLLALPAYTAEDSGAFDLLPPGARIVFGVRVRAVVNSSLAQSLSSEIVGASGDWQKLIAVAGFDPLHDLDELVLASTGEGKEAPVLIVVRGTFDTARLAAKAKPYHGVPLVSIGEKLGIGEKLNVGAKAAIIAILDASTILTGDPAEVKAAIDRRGSPTLLDPALAARIADYRQHYEIWGVADNPAGLARRLSDSSGPQPFDSIDRFQLGLGLNHGLEIAAELHARSAEDAAQLTSSLRLLEAMFKASQPSANAGTKLNIESSEGTLKIALAVSEEDLKKAIAQQRRTASAARTPAPAPAFVPAPAPAPVPAPVRIQSSRSATRPGVQSGNGGTSVLTLPSHP
jgi:hypothetical protein